jgi:transcriptional regulator with XRE-family HTH domain
MMRARSTWRVTAAEDRYRELFAEGRRKRLSRRELAEKAGVDVATVSWWKCELTRRDKARRAEGGSELLPVVVREDDSRVTLEAAAATDAPEGSAVPFEIVLASGRVVRVPRTLEARDARALALVLEVASC